MHENNTRARFCPLFRVPAGELAVLLDLLPIISLAYLSETCTRFAALIFDEGVWRRRCVASGIMQPSLFDWVYMNSMEDKGRLTKGQLTTWGSVYKYHLAEKVHWLNSVHVGREKNWDLLLKFLVVGDSSVAKHKMSFIQQQCQVHLSEDIIATIGVDFGIAACVWRRKTIKAQVWDTAGQERFNTITRSYYRGAHGIFLLFDVTNRDSFEGVNRWCEEINKYGRADVIMLVIGCRPEVEIDTGAVVSEEEGTALATSLSSHYVECSAFSGDGVVDAYNMMVQKCAPKMLIEASVNGAMGLSGVMGRSENEARPAQCRCM